MSAAMAMQTPQQPTPTDIEVSNERAAELTAARAEIAQLREENARLAAGRARIDMCERCGLHPTCGMSVSYNGSWPPTHLCRPCYDAETQPQQPHAFTGQGHRLGE